MRRIEAITAATGLGIVFLFSNPGIITENPSAGGNDTIPNSQPSEHLVPIPCPELMPWETQKQNNGQTGKIILASLKKPDPTPNRNKPECWKIIRDGGTIFPQPSEL